MHEVVQRQNDEYLANKTVDRHDGGPKTLRSLHPSLTILI